MNIAFLTYGDQDYKIGEYLIKSIEISNPNANIIPNN